MVSECRQAFAIKVIKFDFDSLSMKELREISSNRMNEYASSFWHLCYVLATRLEEGFSVLIIQPFSVKNVIAT